MSEPTYGVFFADGTQKPAFDAFRFPFVADAERKGKLLIWGKAPAAGRARDPAGGPEWLGDGGSKHAVKRGVFTTKLKIQGPATLRAAIGSDVSLPWGV